MKITELQQALREVEPAAVLVSPRVIERVIQQVYQLPGMVWSVPHRRCFVVDRGLLFRHVEQDELSLDPEHLLPSTVILLARPASETLGQQDRGAVLQKYWRRLFHSCVHVALGRRTGEGRLSDEEVRARIEAIGPAEFEEVRAVLQQDHYLLAKADERSVYIEFAAVYLELRYFAPHLLAGHFPGIRDFGRIDQVLARDLNAEALFERTRLAGAPDPVPPTDTGSEEAHDFYYRLMRSGDRASEQGNNVRAAILRTKAARVAPVALAGRTRVLAEGDVHRLIQRLQAALELTDDEVIEWARVLPPLLEKADQGNRPVEATLLYDLQDVCIAHEREIYTLDLVEWLSSGGRRPIKRPLPSQRLVRITKHLRLAAQKLAQARLSDADRRHLGELLQGTLAATEERLRTRFRPILLTAFQDVGLTPTNAPEKAAFAKVVEEILDRIIAAGFFTFGDLRDTLSRNPLKLPDLDDPQDFIRGDPLLRLDRRLATLLDGVYRPSEFYTRWLERTTALGFGTHFGRKLTRFLLIPFGGAAALVYGLGMIVDGVKALPEAIRNPLSSGYATVVKVWDAEKGTKISQHYVETGNVSRVASTVAFSPDGSRIATANEEQVEKGKQVWDAAGRGSTPEWSRPDQRVTSVKVWDAAGGREMRSLLEARDDKGSGSVLSLAFSPDGTRLAAGGADDVIRIWNAERGDLVLSLAGHAGPVRCVAFSPDGTRIASGSDDQTVKVWDADNGTERHSLEGHTGPVLSVAFSPDGTRIASGSDDQTVKVWDAGEGAERLTLKGHAGPVLSVAFSPDGTRLASGGADQTVKVWDAGEGEALRTLSGHADAVTAVAFSPDGARLASGSKDNTVKVWDVGQGAPVLSLASYTGDVLGVRFSADGGRLATAAARSEFHLHGLAQSLGAPFWVDLILVGVTGFFLLALVHLPAFRLRCRQVLVAGFRFFRAIFFRFPSWAVRASGLQVLSATWVFQLFYWYVCKPLVACGVLWLLWPDIFSTLPGIVIGFFAASFLINSRFGQAVGEVIYQAFASFYEVLRAGLLSGLYRFVVHVFKRIIDSLEYILFSVDEWLRYRGGEGTGSMVVRTILGLLWFPVSYVSRFYMVVLIEPMINPIKLPVSCLAAKFVYPLVLSLGLLPLLSDTLTPLVGGILAYFLAATTVYLLPDAFGFLFWETKENWSLYEANRRTNVRPVPVGTHGESMHGLLHPGFHSGTVPKLFTRLRRAEQDAERTGNWRAARSARESLADLERTVGRFVQRDLIVMLGHDPSWRDEGLIVGRVMLSINRIRVELAHPAHPDDPVWLEFEDRSAWLLACVHEPGWLGRLSRSQHRTLARSLINLYKLSGVELVREQVRACLPGQVGHYDVTDEELLLWRDKEPAPAARYDLLSYEGPIEPRVAEGEDGNWPALRPQELIFARAPLSWREWVASWEPGRDGEDGLLSGPLAAVLAGPVPEGAADTDPQSIPFPGAGDTVMRARVPPATQKGQPPAKPSEGASSG